MDCSFSGAVLLDSFCAYIILCFCISGLVLWFGFCVDLQFRLCLIVGNCDLLLGFVFHSVLLGWNYGLAIYGLFELFDCYSFLTVVICE